jgi:Serine dehydrogenase proteinase
VVVYAADWTGKGGLLASMDLNDVIGLMEVFRDLNSTELDLILHSGGGNAEACNSLVNYMRSKFDHVRVFVPLGAMSAATMWALAADEIVMGNHSQLGPIDPQFILPQHGIQIPAGSLTAQFKEASDQCLKEPGRLAAWLPTLQQYPPGLLEMCEKTSKLAKELVEQWLKRYMLKDEPHRDTTARETAEWLADDKVHLSDGRPITGDQLREKGLNVTELAVDQQLQDAVLTVFHAVLYTISPPSPVMKVIENQVGRRYVKTGGAPLLQQVMIPQPPPPQQPQPQPAPPPQQPAPPQQQPPSAPPQQPPAPPQQQPPGPPPGTLP